MYGAPIILPNFIKEDRELWLARIFTSLVNSRAQTCRIRRTSRRQIFHYTRRSRYRRCLSESRHLRAIKLVTGTATTSDAVYAV